MANIIRSAKSGSDWVPNDWKAYHISVDRQSAQWQFFGSEPNSTLDYLDPTLVSGPLDSVVVSSGETSRFLGYLDLATRANIGQESAIDDFSRVLGFEDRGTLLRSRYTIPLTISGDTSRVAQTDICLVHRNTTILLVIQEDKTLHSAVDPEPQVIAKAIAAFQYNNRMRVRAGMDEMDEMIIPCITIMGTRPVFYKVPVSRELNEAVMYAHYPTGETEVTKCMVTPSSRLPSEGMEMPDFRRKVLQHYDAFKSLARQWWSPASPDVRLCGLHLSSPFSIHDSPDPRSRFYEELLIQYCRASFL